ncbi:hypothetical protein L6452_22597 [Arctium lappa]|uniref:Uncharacterized protein n=1 Tax=Arctium lappa TaxID=4217 RepID=A0ACB9B081_ARCLA|nr:hypothetical protein L6452_22597 [Arctium lappa]
MTESGLKPHYSKTMIVPASLGYDLGMLQLACRRRWKEAVFSLRLRWAKLEPDVFLMDCPIESPRVEVPDEVIEENRGEINSDSSIAPSKQYNVFEIPTTSQLSHKSNFDSATDQKKLLGQNYLFQARVLIFPLIHLNKILVSKTEMGIIGTRCLLDGLSH